MRHFPTLALYLTLTLLLPIQAAAQFVPDAFSQYAEAARDSFDVPGMSIAIVKDGEVVFSRGFGVRHLVDGGEVDGNTLFAIASNTKGFIATMIAQLVDAGAVGWDDKVRDYLPGFAMYDPYVTSDIRIRDLLSHSSGLGTFSGDLLWYGTAYTAADVVERIRYVPQAKPFRGGYGYSNLMFITAGEVIKAVSGQSWDVRAQEHIFDQIGMTRTVTSTTVLPQTSNVAAPHKLENGSSTPIEWFNWDTPGAAGGIISSTRDLTQWMMLHLNHGVLGGDTLFSMDASHEMWSPQTVIPLSRTSLEFIPERHFSAYGLGFALYDYKGRKIVTHGGGYDGMFSRVTMVPEENLGIVILTNGMTSVQTALTYRLLDDYLGADGRDWVAVYLERAKNAREREIRKWADREASRVEGTSPSKALADYTGTYGGDMYGDGRITLADGKLVLELLPNKDLVADLTHWHYDTFKLEWRQEFAWFNDGWIQFELDIQGDVIEMKMDVPNDDFWFYELELKRKHAP